MIFFGGDLKLLCWDGEVLHETVSMVEGKVQLHTKQTQIFKNEKVLQ